MTSTDARDTELAAQYEAYPYPERDPREEAKRLLIGSPSHLREIDYWVFGARRPRSQPLRALVAGCGTGDGAIMLATQMARGNRPGEVVCVDRSEHALKIARSRAETRNLGNIRFIQGSLTDPATLPGQFDYIDCCGVLHHLPAPLETLQILEQALLPGGGMGLMVYAPYGRTGVYMLQEALERLTPFSESPSTRLDIAKRVMRTLPATAWLRENGNFGDHLTGGDAGLYDLLLNPRDRAYTISAFLDLLAEAGLEPSCLMEPARYDPSLFLPDPKLRARVENLSWRQKAEVAESLTGNMATHVAYVVRNGARPTPPDCCAPTTVPVMREIPGDELAKLILPNGTLPFSFGTLTVPVPLPAQARSILPLIDGERTVAAIAGIMQERGLSERKFFTVWSELFSRLESLNRVLLLSPV
ncbi:class I SAM-dependent methyltransferase [Acetobacter sp.]|jgi:SAM-dependent methyltransferase|uniref:class I SAM-dependent methyltransferase n=1 Tax=Acetobacter sp. TaxID=440 RepID=UPI0025B85EDD|nr:class I SAM-dependent methyltransferase [Acetobacter sp.]MCH4091046.1 class I SAM-dependent methyltransferase [Acetobacter sp.]MCI1300229.1 class I SAM-dependent methyltransferase [Acetobacter sp.]MCI1316103.1 class I SAM-dependent methyltransferase [Acetobacter sp.]